MSGGFATAQVSIDTTSGGVVVAAARPGRKSVKVINHGTTACYLGHSGLTTGTGALLPGVLGVQVEIETDDVVYGISGGTQVVSVIEVY